MVTLRKQDKALLPIYNIRDVVQLFRNHLTTVKDPDLAFLSIVVGAVENSLTCQSHEGVRPNGDNQPLFNIKTIEKLYRKFYGQVQASFKSKLHVTKRANRDLIRKVSDTIWNSLERSYFKDRAHLQSLYSYLTSYKLDCFGVAFAVVAACQALGYGDVHLALSEDHAWVVYGEKQSESIEVTWHGRANEDKRGQEITKGVITRSWLYVNSMPVICNRHMEVAALVSAINPSLSSTQEASEVALMQQELLWLLYDFGHLEKYPMAIGNLGDLEEISPKSNQFHCQRLYEEAVESARRYYNNQHVYPYTYQGGYYYRQRIYDKAIASWADASDVIAKYIYSRDDEEIYKEFLEIAVELIPNMVKVDGSPSPALSFLKNPQCYGNLLRFYDGICQWEEGSATPVLHIGWAKAFVNAISKFNPGERLQVHVLDSNYDGSSSQLCENNFMRSSNADLVNYSNMQSENCHVRKNDGVNSTIEALAAACAKQILNPEYLLQGDCFPFVCGGTSRITTNIHSNITTCSAPRLKDATSQGRDVCTDVPHISKNSANQRTPQKTRVAKKKSSNTGCSKNKSVESLTSNQLLFITLHSQKMKQLKSLLMAEKLNTHAIQLHLTAQSQVQITRRKCLNDSYFRPKRFKRSL